METLLQNAFQEIGARLASEMLGSRFESDIVNRNRVEAYQFQYPHNDQIEIEVVDVHRHLRQLVLDVTGSRLPISGRYLCGHDESHWFVAGLEFGRKTMTVRGAMESLKPALVRREQRRKGIRHRLNRRKTAAYIRQGEWFFLPRPKMQVAAELVEYRGQLARKVASRTAWTNCTAFRAEWKCLCGEMFGTSITRPFTLISGIVSCRTMK